MTHLAFLFMLLALITPVMKAMQRPALPVPAEKPSQPWITIHEGGERLHLGTGPHIRFEGIGHLQFAANRALLEVQHVQYPVVVIDGIPIRETHAVVEKVGIAIRGLPATYWHIRPATEEEVTVVTDATHIIDDAPDSSACVDADTPIVFFIYVDESGATSFVYPDPNP